MAMDRLNIRGARQHNLQNIDLSLPRNRLVVVTGPSGSGKSSLAFDTIYAEGQRRYVESLSAYARQFLEQLAKPDVDAIEGLSPAIAIEQRALAKNPRSTVGTVTEIADYLRLLFARLGIPHCPSCGERIEAQTPQQIVDRLLQLEEQTRCTLLAPVCRGRKGELKIELERLRREGFVRVRIDGQIVDLGDQIVLGRTRSHDLDVVVDRIVVRASERTRITDSVELALELGDGVMLVAVRGEAEPRLMSERFACVPCGLSLPPIEPRMFSFNGPHGACEACGGLGARWRVDTDRIVPNPTRSLREGAIVAWGRRGSIELANEVAQAVKSLGVDPDTPFIKLPKKQRDALLYADPSSNTGRKTKRKQYAGIVVRLEALLDGDDDVLASATPSDDLESERSTMELGRFVVTVRCDVCKGQRLRQETLAVRLRGMNIAEFGALPLPRVRTALEALLEQVPESDIGPQDSAIAQPLVRAISERIGFLIDVGLDYLSLDRAAHTLSGGEGQRIRLATQIGSALVGVLYVLDEPSVGLHPRDNDKLLTALRHLVTLGNSVLVVEHDRDAILAADYVVDMGPAAGIHGGHIVAQGTPEDIMHAPESVTGPYLLGTRRIEQGSPRRKPGKAHLRLLNARANNLRGVTVDIPVGVLTAVTGVSGSGKSSLIIDTLLAAARAALYRASGAVGDCDGVDGLEHIDKVISIDQAPIGRTPRSNPATYTGLFSVLRDLYAGMPEARTRGYKSGRFSFNVKGGRCEACLGDGVLRVEMHFLPDVFVTCEACNGKRYNRETLEVLYRGMSIADALMLTVDEALKQFESVRKIRDRLAALAHVGLGYVKLGQPATTLSGGEAQRVKLARELAKKATGRTLYVLDEPTTGLHFSDIEMLMVAIAGLRDAGNTVVVIEHNIDVIACCDWVIDMGPGGGEHGGQLLANGPPETIAATAASHTGRFLREHFEQAASPGGNRSKTTAKTKTKAKTKAKAKTKTKAKAKTKTKAKTKAKTSK
jgi:excinuclease ABC subunit A